MDDEFTTPIEWDKEGNPTLYRWDSDRWFNSLKPYEQRNRMRKLKVWDMAYGLYRILPWMNWPILSYVYAFWHSLFEDGLRSTCSPRWGAVTFGWLNDGMKPTLWHTWHQLTHNHMDKYAGIYPSGAPHNKREAEAYNESYKRT